MRWPLDRVLRKAKSWIRRQAPRTGAAYWEDRAKRFGRRAVLNLSHAESEFDLVTERQTQLLFPLLTAQLQGHERRVLDFGCGPGRFTASLAQLVGGEAIGFDVSHQLVALAPKSAQVSYVAGDVDQLNGHDPFDVVWVCLVLGGIESSVLGPVANLLGSRLRPGGLLFLVENTTRKPDLAHWFYRDENYYLSLFPGIDLQPISRYVDAGEDICVWAGRKRAAPRA